MYKRKKIVEGERIKRKGKEIIRKKKRDIKGKEHLLYRMLAMIASG